MVEQAEQQLTLEQYEEQLRLGVEQGDPMACFRIVEHFEQKGTAPNKLEANNRVLLLKEASNQGVGLASVLLGLWYLHGHYVKADPAQAILFFEHAANVGKEPQGLLELSAMFAQGIGIPAQPDKAQQYLKRAMDMGHPEAAFQYARQRVAEHSDDSYSILKENYKKHKHLPSLLYLNDEPAFGQRKVQTYLEANSQDPFIAGLLAFRYLNDGLLSQALEFANQSADRDNPIGCHVRSLVEQQRPDGSAQVAYDYMLRAAQLGHGEAAYQVAMIHLHQAEQIEDEQEYQQVLQSMLPFLVQSAHSGFVPAQFSLGQCLLQGIATEKNREEGLIWIERAAQNGHVDAMFTLALNIPVEHEQHLPLLKAAAQAGHTKAMVCMGIYCQNHNYASEAIDWFQAAKAQGDIRANYMLGMAYRDGIGVAANSEQAVALLQEAGEQGDAEAYFTLFESYRDGIGVQQDPELADKYLQLAKEAQYPPAMDIVE